MALISVIVPVYKVEPYIHRCVDSILNQTFTDFELILVDDGSPDNCGAICDEYAEKDKRITVIHQKNGGLSAARNAGLDYIFANSESEWVTFIDSDDYVHQNYLKELYEACIKNNVSLSVCDFLRFTKTGFCEKTLCENIVCAPEYAWTNDNLDTVIACAKMYNKALFLDIRYPIGRLHEDEFTTYKILFQCSKIAFLNKQLYFYFQNENGITQTWDNRRLGVLVALKEQLDFFKNNKKTDCYNYSIKRYYLSLSYLYSLAVMYIPQDKKTINTLKKELSHFIKKNNSILKLSRAQRYKIKQVKVSKIKKLINRIKKKFFRE